MIAPDGTSIQNIYAYDLDGRPVDVLLFDQDGRPLLNLPSYVYEDAEFNPGESEVFYEFGAVRFQRDEFGRIIPNLYPLEQSVYNNAGRLLPETPPLYGGLDTEAELEQSSVVPTTISRGE